MMKKQGLKLEAQDLYNPNGVSLKDAVGIFGGGCTGEIISPEGLILTNHHCGYASIQQHSSVEHDYLTDGFWATSRDKELPTPGLKFTFIGCTHGCRPAFINRQVRRRNRQLDVATPYR